MALYRFIGFKAVATKPNDEEYDAPFMVYFPMGLNEITGEMVNTAVSSAVSQFLQLHPTGSIISQMERTVNMVGR